MNGFKTSIALAVLALASTQANAQASADGISAPIEKCIRDNAAGVEAAITDLNQAVDFLVVDICAGPIADEQAEQTKISAEKQKARWEEMCAEKQVKKHPADSKAVDSANLFCSNLRIGFLTEPSDDETGYVTYGVGAKPPAVVALASRLLLDLRLSHLKSGTKH